MFILQTSGPTDAFELRRHLLQFGMPCAVYSEDEFNKGVTDDRIAVVPDDPNAAVLMASATAEMRVILYADRTLPFGEIISILSDADAVGRIIAAYRRFVPNDPAEEYALGAVRFDGGHVLFCGAELYLTPTEELIVRHLAMNRRKFLTAEHIAAYCLDVGESNVPVHIHNINEKVKRVAYRPLILCRRFSGYSVE